MKIDYTKYFMQKNRVMDGKTFITLTDDRPDDLQELVRGIHHTGNFNGCLPNDWIYQTVLEAFEALNEQELDDCNIEADVYNKDLIEWLQNPYASTFCDDALEMDSFKPINIMGIIEQAQVYAKHEIYQAVNDFLNNESDGE